MPKDDSEPDSDSDLDSNNEMSHATHRKQGKSESVNKKERVERMQQCSDEGAAHVNNADTHDITALHIAVKKGDKAIGRLLIEKGADGHIGSQNDHTALSPTDVFGNKDFLSTSEKHIVDAGTQSPAAQRLSPLIETPSSLASDLSVNNIGQTVKRESTTDIEYTKNTKRRRCDSSDANPQQTSTFGGTGKYVAPDLNSQADHDSSQAMKMEATVQFDEFTCLRNMNFPHKGHGYINQLLILSLHRGLREGYTFRFSKDVEGVGYFDDLSLQYKDKTEGGIFHRFLQVKHFHDGSRMIRAGDLFNRRPSDFRLQKYFISYRKIKEFLQSSMNQLKDCIIWTNCDIDSEGLARENIVLIKVTDNDPLLDIETNPMRLVQPPRYKLSIDRSSDMYKTLQETADVYLLAKTLAEHACKDKLISRHIEMFKLYHTALAMDVINVQEQRFFRDFCGNISLSRRAQKFRSIFYSEFSELSEFSNQHISEEHVWTIIENKCLRLSSNFGESSIPNLRLSDPQEFSEAFLELLKSADSNNLVKVERRNKVITNDIRKLAGHVLVAAECKNIYKIRSQFFEDSRTQPEAIQNLKKLLKARLGNKYNSLGRYRFEINDLSAYKEEDEFPPQIELPDDDMIIDQEIQEFFDKLVFAVNQPNYVELASIITRELAAGNQFSPENTNLAYNSLLDDTSNWFNDDRKFITEEDGKAIFHSVEGKLNSLVCSGLSLSYLAGIRQYGIGFKSQIQKLEEFLIAHSDHKGNQSVLNLIAAEETLLTLIRVQQSIRKVKIYEKDDSWMCLTLDMLLRPEIARPVVRAFDSPQSNNLLVVECGSAGKEDLQKLCDKLREPLAKNCHKKLVLITKCADIQSNIHLEVCVEKRDEVSFNNLTEDSQQKLLERPLINFQGKEGMSFGKFLENCSSDKIESNKSTDFGSVIDSSTLVKLIHNEEIEVGVGLQNSREPTDIYITRRCHHQVFLKKDILKCQLTSEIFAISGSDPKKLLETLMIDQGRIQSFREIDRRTQHLNQIVILDSEENGQKFETLCADYSSNNYNIHWLENKSNRLIWKTSRGDTTYLLKYRDVDESTASYLTEDDLAGKNEENEIVIISNCSGMGKTTMFRYLARKIKAETPDLWVINIDMNSFTKVRQNELSFDGNDIDQATEFFVEKLATLKTDLEKKLLKIIIKNHGRVALLFDGFDEISTDYGERVIDLLKTFKKRGIEKLFVSTRPHLTDALEKRLRIFHHSMEPFSNKDQRDFLIKFWQARPGQQDVEERVELYAKALIKMVGKSIRDITNEFSGIPLQTQMIAEAFLCNEDGEVREFETCEEFLRSGKSTPKLPRKMKIVDLYGHFVDRKHNIYYREKIPANLTIGTFYEASFTKIFLKMHQKSALYVLFDTEELSMLLGRQAMESLQDQIRKITKGNDQTGIITHIRNGKPQFVHRSFAEYFTAIFLIKQLKKVDHNQQAQKFIVDQILLQSQHCVIRAFLNELLNNSSYEEEAFTNGSWKSALAEGRNSRHQTIFHVAIQERNDGIIKNFLPRFGGRDETAKFLNDAKDESGRTALYEAAFGQHWNQLKLLVESGGADVNCCDSNGETPLHWAAFNGGRAIVKWLVENGADPQAESNDNRKPIHSAARSGQLKVLEWFIHKTKFPVDSLLHDAGISDAPLTVFQWLVEKRNANLEARDDCGKSVLYKTASWGQADVVKWLVTKKGVKLDHEADGGTELVRQVAEKRHWEIVKCLVEFSAFDITAEDTDGNTILERAIKEAILDDITWLVEKKSIDVNAKLLVHYSAKCGRLDVVQWLVTGRSADLTKTDASGKTVLHYAAVGGSLKTIEFLVGTGEVDVSHVDDDNTTALHVYYKHHASNRNLAIVNLLGGNTCD